MTTSWNCGCATNSTGGWSPLMLPFDFIGLSTGWDSTGTAGLPPSRGPATDSAP